MTEVESDFSEFWKNKALEAANTDDSLLTGANPFSDLVEASFSHFWTRVEKLAFVQYAFTSNGPYQLSLYPSSTVYCLKEAQGWYVGFALDSPDHVGIFPVTFVQLGSSSGSSLNTETSHETSFTSTSGEPPAYSEEDLMGSGSMKPVPPAEPQVDPPMNFDASAPSSRSPSTSSRSHSRTPSNVSFAHSISNEDDVKSSSSSQSPAVTTASFTSSAQALSSTSSPRSDVPRTAPKSVESTPKKDERNATPVKKPVAKALPQSASKPAEAAGKVLKCKECGCPPAAFRQNAFKKGAHCSICFHVHPVS